MRAAKKGTTFHRETFSPKRTNTWFPIGIELSPQLFSILLNMENRSLNLSNDSNHDGRGALRHFPYYELTKGGGGGDAAAVAAAAALSSAASSVINVFIIVQVLR